jgi:hypothetical protein
MVRRVRIIKKVQDTKGSWKFVSLVRTGNRYVWDSRPGFYFLDWRDGKKRLRERACTASKPVTSGESKTIRPA